MEMIGTNLACYRVGQYHQHARLTDAEVDQIRDLHYLAGFSYGQLSKAYETPKGTIATICRFERRNRIYENWKRGRGSF